MGKGELFKTIIELFKSLDYTVYYKVLNSADYGVPQIRERVIIVGTKFKNKYFFPKPTHTNSNNLFEVEFKPYLTLVKQLVIYHLLKAERKVLNMLSHKNEFQKLMRKNAPEKLMDHNAPKNNEKLVKIMELLPDGGTPQDLPEELRPKVV